ncbi:putative leucine-rich repeat domain superfamily [Plasmopara halstedii]
MPSRVSLRDVKQRSAVRSFTLEEYAMARTLRQARQSGTLNLSSRDLRAFPDEIFRLYDELDEDENSWECVALKKLDLSYNEIAEIPSQVETLKYLVNFKIRHNLLRQLPTTIWNLEMLTSLDLSSNELEGALPEQLGILIKLRELGLGGNKLTQLPESIGELVDLKELRVESNRLAALPSTIGNLKNLKLLSAHSNEIKELPMSFRSLIGLLTLELKDNSLSTVNGAFQELRLIKYIDLRQNKLLVFPKLPRNNTSLDQLLLGYNLLGEIPEDVVLTVKESLTVLDVRDNKLQRLSSRIPELFRLKTLDVTNNDLHQLPPGLGYLKHLDHLLVAGNPLRSIRRSVLSGGTETLKKFLRTRGNPPKGVDAMEEEIDELTKQQTESGQDEPMAEEDPCVDYEHLFRDANISGNMQLVAMKLCHLPEQLFAAGKYRFRDTLLQLDLSKNLLVELPAAIGDLDSLRILTAEQCGLKSIHASITMISRLEHLRLSKNLLTSDGINMMLCLDKRAKICTSLKELDLRNNELTEVPQALQFLKMMDKLLLSFNHIRTFNTFPWSSLQNLTVLSAANNCLDSCGAVHRIPKIASLSLENNELRQIPVELALCVNLRALYLAGNPQRGIRTQIINSGTEAILKYLRMRLPKDVVPPTGSSASTKASDTLDSALLSNQKTESPMSNQEVVKKVNSCIDALPSNPSLEPSALALTKQSQPLSSMPVSAAGPALFRLPEDEVLAELNAKILKIEQLLDDFAISAAKRFALKKELAMARSLKIRLLRKCEQNKL